MYNFKKNAKLYYVDSSNNRYSLDVYADISASQTYDEQSYRQKTLHSLNSLHEAAVISKALPANFSFTSPILDEASTPPLLLLATQYSGGTVSSGDFYIELDNFILKIEKAVIQTLTFNIARDSILTASYSGSASRLSVVGSVPGIPIATGTKTYTSVERASVSINGTTIGNVAAMNIEFSNNITWTPYDTLHGAITSTTLYPSSYVVSERVVSGSITEFITSNNLNNLTDYSTSGSVDITVGTAITPNLLRFYLPTAVFTRRVNIDELITRVYDFRLISNNTIVKPIYKGV